MNLLVSTNWCAHADGRANNPNTSKRMYDKNYLGDIWWRHVADKIEIIEGETACFVYESRCDRPTSWPTDPMYTEMLLCNQAKVEEQNHAHDVYAGMTMAAQYALVNGMDWLYIEQDCLVYGLDKVLKFTEGKKMCIGGGEYAWQPGWAEESLMWVSNEYLPTFIQKINAVRLYETEKIPEPIVMQMFKDDATLWPFGYGRKRPIDFDQEVFYAQQLSDEELDKFIEKLGL